MQRLNFRLPDFTRYAWVSDYAKEIWWPRITAIKTAYQDMMWRAILAGFKQCSLYTLDPQSYMKRAKEWNSHNLIALPLDMYKAQRYPYASISQQAKPDEQFEYRIVVGKQEDVIQFKQAWDNKDDEEIGKLLGYPDCCIQFFKKVWVEQQFFDTTWPMALTSTGHAIDQEQEQVNSIEIQEYFNINNILWRWMSIRVVPHLPCSFNCENTRKFGGNFIELAHSLKFKQEIDWLLEILSWPAEWTALHGIAEIKTPILKVSTCSDATAILYRVGYKGTSYPKESLQGLSYVYQNRQFN